MFGQVPSLLGKPDNLTHSKYIKKLAKFNNICIYENGNQLKCNLLKKILIFCPNNGTCR